MQELPIFITILFILTTVLTLWILYKATGNSSTFLYIVLGWIFVQSLIGLTGFYADSQSMPPRFSLLVLPPVITIIILFLTNKGKIFLDRLNIRYLTLLHIVRIPVEIVLFWLFLYKVVPQVMTFEGRNWDILSGISAVIIYFLLIKRRINPALLLLWNLLCLGLLFNIMYYAILSAATSFQQFGFEQPNIAVTYFPFILLPGFIVPSVLFSHLTSLRLLLVRRISIAEEYLPG